MRVFTLRSRLGQTGVWCSLEVLCANLKVANSNPILRFHRLLYSFCCLRRLVQKFESKQRWWMSKLVVSRSALRLWFTADILLIIADSRLQICQSRILLTRNVFGRRCAEAKSPCCLLELEWKQIQFSHEALPILSSAPPPSFPASLFLPLLPIQLQYLAPVNSFTLANNAQEDPLLSLICCQLVQLHIRRSQSSGWEIYSFAVKLPDL